MGDFLVPLYVWLLVGACLHPAFPVGRVGLNFYPRPRTCRTTNRSADEREERVGGSLVSLATSLSRNLVVHGTPNMIHELWAVGPF